MLTRDSLQGAADTPGLIIVPHPCYTLWPHEVSVMALLRQAHGKLHQQDLLEAWEFIN